MTMFVVVHFLDFGCCLLLLSCCLLLLLLLIIIAARSLMMIDFYLVGEKTRPKDLPGCREERKIRLGCAGFYLFVLMRRVNGCLDG